MRGLARRTDVSRRTAELRLRRSRDFLLSHTTWPTIPPRGRLICIGDGFVFLLQGQWYTCHLMLLRGVSSDEAVILPPVILGGAETQISWRKAFETIPIRVRSRIRALVCDGHRGLVNTAKRERWIIQRCHFHLLASIGGRRSRSRWSRHLVEGQRIYKLAKAVLDTTDESRIPELLRKIDDEALNTSSPKLRRCLRGFISCWEDYRSYQYHPELHLPTTNNTAESLAGCLTELLHKARGYSNITALKKWFAAYIKYKKTIKSRGRNQPNYGG